MAQCLKLLAAANASLYLLQNFGFVDQNHIAMVRPTGLAATGDPLVGRVSGWRTPVSACRPR
jgi:hypothetical protein